MKVNFEDIYQHIGFLFYGLASRDGKLSSQDFSRLTEMLEKNWAHTGNGDPVLTMHLVDCMYEGILYAIGNAMSTDHALASFRTYYRIHPLPFSQVLKERIISSSMLISREFPQRPQHARIKEGLEPWEKANEALKALTLRDIRGAKVLALDQEPLLALHRKVHGSG